jgi:hypothetical protein
MEKIPHPQSSDPVVLSFSVYNHTQGFLLNFEKKIAGGASVTIRIDDLDVEGVDDKRIVIREDRFGDRVAFSKSGVIQFVAPKTNKSYTLYLLNASSRADYRKVDTWIYTNEGVLEYTPPLKWFREDRNGFQGQEEVIAVAFDQLNDALDYPWARYGRFQKLEERENGSFGVGYGHCRDQFGWHSPYWAGVNPDHCRLSEMKLGTFLEEIFELTTRLNDIGGQDTASLITDPETGDLNEVGRDLLAYVFIKDEKI